VVQDLYLSLLEQPQRYATGSDLTGFVYKAVTHACWNRLRNQRTRSRLLHESEAPQRLAPAHGLQPEQLTALWAELARMPETLAAVAIYYYIDGMTHDEIAQLLSCSPRHVGNLVARLQGWSLREQSL
jgi:RNA polymerase sigma-70 factor (ECF subfamily)